MEPLLYAFYIVFGFVLIKISVLLVLCRGNIGNLFSAINEFFSVLIHGKKDLPNYPAHDVKNSSKVNPDLIWPIYLLQRETRLFDFLLEDISGASDDLVGAGVREVHAKCRKYLLEKLKLEPIINQEEGKNITLEDGFDPSKIMLTGYVEGKPPYQGILKHRGWNIISSQLPETPESFRKNPILAQAEVEIPLK